MHLLPDFVTEWHCTLTTFGGTPFVDAGPSGASAAKAQEANAIDIKNKAIFIIVLSI